MGRWSVNRDDLVAVHALQDATTLAAVDSDATAADLPRPPASGEGALEFWERYRVWSQKITPPERDKATQALFSALGLTGDTPITADHSFV